MDVAISDLRANLRDLGRRDLERAEQAWARYWAAVRAVELTQTGAGQAGELASQHGLRGADAVHLASALVIGEAELVMAVWDRRLHGGALAAGVSVAPGTLPA